MSGIRISDYTVANLVDALRSAIWQVPRFQREFVWDTAGIAGLATSIIDAYPIGMITLWEQSDRDPLDMERLSIQDYDAQKKSTITRYFGEDKESSKIYAILDGRQRCTAVAMAFSGFTPQHKGNKHAGRYFLNASQPDPLERVVFKKTSELNKEGLATAAACIGRGLFPLASDIPGEGLLQQWYRYGQEIRNPANYPDGVLPDQHELNRRNQIVQSAFDGINETRLAACIVPEKYNLGQICEIFETLNLSGMKVSTVDLINSWVYRETEDAVGGPIHIREWIRELGELDGAVGWAVPERRPELIAQIATAAFLSLESDDKPAPRQVSGNKKVTTIDSIKSPDLLATPAEHWQNVIKNDKLLAGYLGDFQIVVAGGLFGYDKCPYPISASIYTGLRWHKAFDPPSKHSQWAIGDLDSLFKAFFWRNALGGRYDQGFLTTLSKDILKLKELLRVRSDYQTKSAWLQHCDQKLANYMAIVLPDEDALIDLLTNGRPGGAKQSAMMLPMIAQIRKDIDGVEIGLGSETRSDLHHIYPKSWCKDNSSGPLKELFDKEAAGRNWVDSIANLIPLARTTNNSWSTKSPQTFLEQSQISYENGKPFWEKAFIGPVEFDILFSGRQDVLAFWQRRAKLIALDLLQRAQLSV